MKNLYIAVLSVAVLCACSRAQEPARTLVRLAPSCVKEGVRLTIVGDSLARGWGASSPAHSFASFVYADVRKVSPAATIRNLGTPGATSDDIASKEVPNIQIGDCSLVVIISGANDVQKLYTPSHFRRSYGKLLQKVRGRLPNGALVVMGLPDVSLSPIIPWPLKPVESWLSRDGSAAIAASAQQYGAAFVPLYDISRHEAHRSNSLLSRDGIHPNDEGYLIMAGTALPSIMMVIRAKPVNT